MENSSIIFGPIPSRRFGLSLGIDLSPKIKQCNFDCLYCELDGSSTVSKQSDDILSVKNIISKLKDALKEHTNIDVITFTANGEPTLYPYLSNLIDEVDKLKGNKKTLILSNGANIYKKEIQDTLAKIDMVKLSLDCISPKCFKKLDRINSSVECDKIVPGMIEFRKIFKNQLILEILFVKELNDTKDEIELLYQNIKKISPNRVDIGTIVRPPAYKVKPVEYEFLESVANRFEQLPVVITHKNIVKKLQSFTKDEIINLLLRRPLTYEDIKNSFDKSSQQLLNNMLDQNILKIVQNNNIEFIVVNTD